MRQALAPAETVCKRRRRRKRLIAVLSVVLMLPATLLTALGMIWSVRYLEAALTGGGDARTSWMVAVIWAGGLGLVAGWSLLIRFLHGSRFGFAGHSRALWGLSLVGILAAAAGALMALSGEGWVFAVGVPVLLPWIRLYREARRADNARSGIE